MPGDERRISILACVLLVTLRLAIGWHLFYEGIWKLNTLDTATPWTAEGYLKNATGPLRSTFRALTGDPNDLNWLDYDKVANRWADWKQRFVAHYGKASPNDAEQLAKRVDQLLDGNSTFFAPLEALPPGIDLARWKNVIQYDGAEKRLIVSRDLRMLPAERDALLALVATSAPEVEVDVAANPDNPALAQAVAVPTSEPPATADELALRERFRIAVTRLYDAQAKLAFRERLAAMLKGDPERVGLSQKDKDGTVIESRLGDIELYKKQIERYEASLKGTHSAFEWDHLSRQYRELSDLRRRVVGPVQALEYELKNEAEQLLNEVQLAAGPVPEPWTQMRLINYQTMWGLTILGVLLMAGLFTRLSAFGAACLMTMFYLAVPPWPGTPPDYGPEHNFIVNKLLVEIIAALALAALPTGRWFGIDALFAALFYRPDPDDL